MKKDALYRVIGGMVLVGIAIVVLVVKLHDADILASVSADPLLPAGCLAIALLGVLVSNAGLKSLRQVGAMTRLIVTMVQEMNRVVTGEIAGTVGVHETEVRERVDEMIKKREIPAGVRIVYAGGEKVVK
jgi:hypothetical protein